MDDMDGFVIASFYFEAMIAKDNVSIIWGAIWDSDSIPP